MRRVLYTVIILLVCMCLASCHTNSNMLENNTTPTQDAEEPQEEKPEPAETDEPEVTTPESSFEATPEPSKTEEPAPDNDDLKALDSLSFAHADLVYADPDAYKGKEYSSPFKILTEPMWYEDVLVSYAVGFSNSDIQTYTALVFAEEAPELTVNETVYVRGTIDGKGFTYDANKNAVDLLLLVVGELEKEIVSSDVQPAEKEIRFEQGQFAAKSDTLGIEVTSLTFQQDTMYLSTKTIDEAADGFTTYYFDIILHQDGYFAWYHDCNYWIDKGIEGFDNVPFPVMQTDKNITIEFVPFSEDGELLYEPLVIEVDLDGE